MTQQVKERSELGERTKIAQGGQGVVYHAPKVRTRFAASLVYKEYKDQVRAVIDFEALAAVPAFLESLPYAEGEQLISIAAWPCEMVEDAGEPTGFVMPAIPDQFYISLTTLKGTSRNPAEFQHLLNSKSVLLARGISIDDVQRLTLVREVASGLAFLHRHGVCVGDISPKNLLFSLTTDTAIYFIDCDAMRINGVSALTQVETPGWEVPHSEELATVYSDTYKLGLLALRLLSGNQDTRNVNDLPENTPTMVRRIITDALRGEPDKRPLPEAWTYQLGHAIEEAQHRQASQPADAPPKRAPTTPSRATHATAASAPPKPPPPAPSSSDAEDDTSSRNEFAIAALVAIVIVVVVLIAIVITAISADSNSRSVNSSSPSTNDVSSNFLPENSATPSAADTPSAETTTTPLAVISPAPTNRPFNQPSWDGPWLRNYWEDEQDCKSGVGGLDYWVVQPGDESGMYALKKGCFPNNWAYKITSLCQSLNLPAGQCAVWDRDGIMSVYGKHGDLLVVAITRACLQRAGLPDFHEGPIHQDCVVGS